MSFETVCQKCGKITRALLPVVKKDDSLVFVCGECDHDVIRMFGEEAVMTEYIRNLEPTKVEGRD